MSMLTERTDGRGETEIEGEEDGGGIVMVMSLTVSLVKGGGRG